MSTTTGWWQVPKRKAAVEPRERVFEPGAWIGEILKITGKDIPTNQSGDPFAGYETADGEILGIWIGKTQPQEGQTDMGDSIYFLDLVMRDGQRTIANVDVDMQQQPYWQLQRSARLLTAEDGLAVALDYGVVTESGVDLDPRILEDLEAEDFPLIGRKVGFMVYHRTFNARDPNDPTGQKKVKKVSAEIGSFFPAP